eukprot:281280-Pleurochrysis_carterae.AAC.3
MRKTVALKCKPAPIRFQVRSCTVVWVANALVALRCDDARTTRREVPVPRARLRCAAACGVAAA